MDEEGIIDPNAEVNDEEMETERASAKRKEPDRVGCGRRYPKKMKPL